MKKFCGFLLLACCLGLLPCQLMGADKSDGCYVTNDNNREVMLEQYLAGEKAHSAGDYAKALAALQPAAEAGNPNAQYLLGTMYDFGYGIAVDHVKANEWYLKAAQQGQDDAQFNLGISYQIGEGIAKNMLLSVCWIAKAAANGDDDAMGVLTQYAQRNIPEAQYALAQIYRDGVTLHNNYDLYPSESDNSAIAADKAKYEQWLKRAAANGHKQAAQALAIAAP